MLLTLIQLLKRLYQESNNELKRPNIKCLRLILIFYLINMIDEINPNRIYVKPIVYGSCAFWLGKKADETASHKWCVFVRGNNNEDITSVVKEVAFTLHSSFTNPVRRLTTSPFEIYESGWGEFEIKIQITLHDPSLRVLEFSHALKLYPFLSHQTQSTKKPVMSESYDEIIIINPKVEYFPNIDDEVQIIKKVEMKEEKESDNKQDESQMDNDEIAQTDNVNPSYFSGIEGFFQPISDETQYRQLQEVNTFVTKEIEKMKFALEQNDIEMNTIKKNIKELLGKFK